MKKQGQRPGTKLHSPSAPAFDFGVSPFPPVANPDLGECKFKNSHGRGMVLKNLR